EDVNDNTPVFVSAASVRVPEDTPPRSAVATVRAVDEDSGPNGHVSYHLNDTSGGTFSIDSRSGEMYLEKTLDREEADTLTVAVTAVDGGSPQRSAIVSLTVHVEDVNDHDPEMLQSSYSLAVREDVPRGAALLQLQARDRDAGPNGQVRYVLTQASPFQVDSVRGVVTVRHQLDREKESNYTLILTAVDLGSTPRSATAIVSVSVLDVNDFLGASHWMQRDNKSMYDLVSL
uniref:Cadherin domain-containing protein n=1 Tax=Salarias fasciatus TaxID=181472 RepID=A0A672J965_SALFA